MKEEIKRLGDKVKSRQTTWQKAAEEFNLKYNESLSGEAFRGRYRTLGSVKDDTTITKGTNEYTTTYQDGTIEAQQIVEYNKEVFGDKDMLLDYLGYDHNEWAFTYITTSIWMQHTKEQETKQLYAVKFKVKPLNKCELTLDEYVAEAKDVFKRSVVPYKARKKAALKGLNDNRLLFIPQIEAHLGKISENIETGTEYNHTIVEERVRKVFEEASILQESEKCDRCLLVIGGDFFNSESNSQTTGGTPQQNDIRYKEMFNIGLTLYRDGLVNLRDHFNHIDVMLCAGNHARAAEFYLYVALSCYFKDDPKITFSDNYRDTQSYVFGKVGMFFNHGDPNQKRLVASIPAEFYTEYGQTIHRYLFLGHLHKLEVVNSENGLTVHRVPAICENDGWHYQNRFGIGNIPQHELMVFDKENGLLLNSYVYF